MAEHPFRTFIELIAVDQAMRTAYLDAESLKQTIADVKRQEQELIQAFDTIRRKVIDARKAVDEQELIMKELEQEERAKRARLEGSSKHKEFQAIKHELETIIQAQQTGEETLLDAWNALENAQKDYEAKQKVHDATLQELHKTIAEKQNAIEALHVRIQELNTQRPEKEQRVPAEWLEKYTIMKVRVADPVVPVLNSSCSACFYHISDQELTRLKRGALLQCKQCFRLLFMQEAVDAAA